MGANEVVRIFSATFFSMMFWMSSSLKTLTAPANPAPANPAIT